MMRIFASPGDFLGMTVEGYISGWKLLVAAAAAEELLKTLDINQTCKKYYHIYARLPRPGPSQAQPRNILFGRED